MATRPLKQLPRHPTTRQGLGEFLQLISCCPGLGLENQPASSWLRSRLHRPRVYINRHQSGVRLLSFSFKVWYRAVLEKAMATYYSTLVWQIPWTEEPGRLQSMGSLGVGHDWATSFSLFTLMHWRRKWQPTPVFLPGESQGRGSLVGCRLWGCTESDMTEVI